MASASRRLTRGLAPGFAPIAVAVIVQSLGSLGFHAVVGRLLDADAYGALGTMLAAMMLLGVPLGALQAAASAMVVKDGLGRAATRRTLRRVAIATVLPAVAVLACAPALRDFFRLDSWTVAAQLAPYLTVSAVLAVARGLLLGAQRVRAVAATYLVGMVVRLVLGLGLVGPAGVAGALLGTLTGEVAALVVALCLLLPRGDDDSHGRLRVRAVARAGVAVTGLFLFSTVDLFLGRHHLAADASGSYVAAATVAKLVLALPAAIMSVVFPRLVAAWPKPGRGRALLSGGMAVAGPALLGAAVLAVAPTLVLRVLYGDGYLQVAALLRVLSVLAALTAVVSVMAHAALARRGWTIALPWAGTVLEVVLIDHWHSSTAQVAACSAAALLPTLLLIMVIEGRVWARPTSQAGPATADSQGTTAAVVTPD